MIGTTSPLVGLIGKLRRLAPLTDTDERAILALPHRVERVEARTNLVREGSCPHECCLLVEGFAARNKLANDGGRQIISFHIAGDILDLQHLFLERADHNVQALTSASVLWIPMKELRAAAMGCPNIGTAFWRDSLIDAAIFREWVLNVGRRDAKTRIAHMLCEFIVRCEVAGLGSPQRMKLPFSQEEIADATGLTPVHVNRMLREMDEEGLIVRSGRTLEIQDWARFKRVATFDRAYLHAAA